MQDALTSIATPKVRHAKASNSSSITFENKPTNLRPGTGVREHRMLERYGDAEADIRGKFESPAGWSGLLERFRQSLDA